MKTSTLCALSSQQGIKGKSLWWEPGHLRSSLDAAPARCVWLWTCALPPLGLSVPMRSVSTCNSLIHLVNSSRRMAPCVSYSITCTLMPCAATNTQATHWMIMSCKWFLEPFKENKEAEWVPVGVSTYHFCHKSIIHLSIQPCVKERPTLFSSHNNLLNPTKTHFPVPLSLDLTSHLSTKGIGWCSTGGLP